jgi:ATP-binding cassette subfamily B (MDR/TAP) protein 9
MQLYGRYFAKLAKRVQAELAEANGVAEEVLSSMTTVKVPGGAGWDPCLT